MAVLTIALMVDLLRVLRDPRAPQALLVVRLPKVLLVKIRFRRRKEYEGI